MSLVDKSQYDRVASLVVKRPQSSGNNPSAFVAGKELDLSGLHIRFRTVQHDLQSPNNCIIRAYNMDPRVVDEIVRNEFSKVTLLAGYKGTSVSEVFVGNIKQFRVGKENATDTYFEILAADGDLAYNFATVGVTLAAGSSPPQRIKAITDAMVKKGLFVGQGMEYTGGVLPRGKVLFGMARVALTREVDSQGGTWSIDNETIHITPLSGVRSTKVTVLDSNSGLIGTPEQTLNGVEAVCLLNPDIEVGSVVKIDNARINQLFQQNPKEGPIPFNQYAGVQNLATVAADGLYRVYVVEHEGDTIAGPWYSRLTCLALNPATNQVKENT